MILLVRQESRVACHTGREETVPTLGMMMSPLSPAEPAVDITHIHRALPLAQAVVMLRGKDSRNQTWVALGIPTTCSIPRTGLLALSTRGAIINSSWAAALWLALY